MRARSMHLLGCRARGDTDVLVEGEALRIGSELAICMLEATDRAARTTFAPSVPRLPTGAQSGERIDARIDRRRASSRRERAGA